MGYIGKAPKYTGEQSPILDPDKVGVFFCTTRDRLLKILSVLQQGAGSYPDDLFESEYNGGFEDKGHIYDIENALAYLNNPLENPCAVEYQPPFWETEDDSDGERDGQRTYEIIGDWAINAFLMTALGPQASIVYQAISPTLKMAFGTTPGGSAVKILIEGLEYGVYQLTDSEQVTDIVIDAVDFLLENVVDWVAGNPYELKIEQPELLPEPQSRQARGQLQVFRKRIRGDAMSYQLRQNRTNKLLLEQSTDGGNTWTTAFNYGVLPQGGGVVTTSTENTIRNETIVNTWQTNNVVNNITINEFTEYDGSANDKARRDALCVAIELTIRGMNEAVAQANAQRTNDINDFIGGVIDFIGASFVAITTVMSAGASVPVYTLGVWLKGMAVANFANSLWDIFVEEATPQDVSDGVTFFADIGVEDALCYIGNNMIYPVTQDGLSNLIRNASSAVVAPSPSQQMFVEATLNAIADMFHNRAWFYDFINVWGGIAENVITTGVDLGNVCECWVKICKNPSPYAITLAPYPSNEVVKQAQVNNGGYLIGGQSSYPVTGGRLWQVGVNYEFTMDSPIARLDSIYIPSAIEGSNAGNGFRTLSFWKGTTLRRGYNTYQLDALGVPKNTIELDLTDNPIMDVDRIVSRVWVQNMATEAQADGQSAWVDTNRMVICGVYPA